MPGSRLRRRSKACFRWNPATWGATGEPDYQAVCTGQTGHVEVVQVTFDPDVVAYREILEVFFAIHDPTTRDRQGNDAGRNTAPSIFYHSEAQRRQPRRSSVSWKPRGSGRPPS